MPTCRHGQGPSASLDATVQSQLSSDSNLCRQESGGSAACSAPGARARLFSLAAWNLLSRRSLQNSPSQTESWGPDLVLPHVLTRGIGEALPRSVRTRTVGLFRGHGSPQTQGHIHRGNHVVLPKIAFLMCVLKSGFQPQEL